MQTIRFKSHYIKSIMNPKIIEVGLSIGHFKTKTTRTKPLRLGEKEIICGVPPRPLYNQIKTEVIIEVVEVEQKPVKDYTPDDMLSDVGYYDPARFLETLNLLNKARTDKALTGETINALHTFRYVEGGENVVTVLAQIEKIETAWLVFKSENSEMPFKEKCKVFKEMQGDD